METRRDGDGGDRVTNQPWGQLKEWKERNRRMEMDRQQAGENVAGPEDGQGGLSETKRDPKGQKEGGRRERGRTSRQ